MQCERAVLDKLFQIEDEFLAPEVIGKILDYLVLPTLAHNDIEVVGSDASCAKKFQCADASEANQLCRWRSQRCNGNELRAAANNQNMKLPVSGKMLPPGKKPFPCQENAVR